MSSIRDTIREKFTDKEIARRQIKKTMNEYNVVGLNGIISELKSLIESGIYENLLNAYENWVEPTDIGEGLSADEKRNHHMIMHAYTILSHPPIKLPFISDAIDFLDFYYLYPFLELIYFMKVGRKLEPEDIINIYFSELGERIVFGLDKFDEISDTPKPTAEFFLKLKKVRWKDGKSKKLLGRLRAIREFLIYDRFGYLKDISFLVKEDTFLLFLSGCSAVNNCRDKMIDEDVITSHRTYFNLLKTDVTKYKVKSGYLICDECNEYYKLKPGESTDNFTGECECGGNLKFYENIDWLLEGGGDVGADD